MCPGHYGNFLASGKLQVAEWWHWVLANVASLEVHEVPATLAPSEVEIWLAASQKFTSELFFFLLVCFKLWSSNWKINNIIHISFSFHHIFY